MVRYEIAIWSIALIGVCTAVVIFADEIVRWL